MEVTQEDSSVKEAFYVVYNPSSRVPIHEYSKEFKNEHEAMTSAVNMSQHNKSDDYYVLKMIGVATSSSPLYIQARA